MTQRDPPRPNISPIMLNPIYNIGFVSQVACIPGWYLGVDHIRKGLNLCERCVNKVRFGVVGEGRHVGETLCGVGW